MKDELGGRIVKEFVGLRANTCSYLIDGNSEDKKAKCTKNCVIKRKFKFKNYKSCLKATQLENRIKQLEKNKVNIKSLREKIQRFKSKRHNVFMEEIHKIDLNPNDHKAIQSVNSVETFAYRTRKDLYVKNN